MASLPNSKTVTYEEWLRMPEVPDAIEEAVSGEIRIMPAPKWKHRRIIELATGALLSPSNTRRDREEKLADYAGNKVPEVWVISPEAGTVEVLYWVDDFLTTLRVVKSGTLTPKLFPNVSIDIATIWAD